MRLSTLLLIISLVSLSAENAYSQKARVSLRMNNVNMEKVFSAIEAQTNYLFIYNNQVDVSDKVSVSSANESVSSVLDRLLANTGISYKQIGSHIVLEKIKGDATEIAQNKKQIKGTVVDAGNIPVIGANVVVKGTTNGTITDLDGNYTLSVSDGDVLVFSYIGYTEQTVAFKGQKTIDITMREDSQALDEIVVVGYGTVKKKDLTGSVGSVKGDDLAARKTTQLSTALQGAVSGVMVTRDNASPGSTASIRIRGVTTIGDSEPLVIVDGVPSDINQVNPNDVESMSVLKDAASASIYGSRAAAGVIVITTKRAKANDLSLNYQFEYGWEIPTQQPEYVGVQRYLEMTNELRFNDNNSGGMFQTYSEDQVNNWVENNKTDPNNYPITDWTDLIMSSSAPRQSHRINISGGSKVVRTKASFSYDKTDGLYKDKYYERFMTRVNNDFTINKYMEAHLDFNFKRSKNHTANVDPLYYMRMAAPVYAATWSDGRYAEGKTGNNPYATMMEGGDKDTWYNRIGGKVAFDIKPIEGMKLSAVVAPVYNFNKAKAFKTEANWTLSDNSDIIGGPYQGLTTTKLTENRNDDYNVTTQFLGNYDKEIDKHSFNFMAGYENYYQFGETLMASRDQYVLDSYPYLDLGPENMRDNSGSANEYAYRSVFGRIMYNYANKYLFQANVRRDGSSRFGKDYRWGTFPSFSLGWVMSEESFIKNLDYDWLSFLKLRGSWGQLGNERIGSYYPSLASISFGNALMYDNSDISSVLTAYQQAYAVSDISWETTESVDFGLDMYFLNSRLKVIFDYYHKTTKDMLLGLEIPNFIGFDNPEVNTGSMTTNGYDLEIGWNDQVGDVRYGISANLSDFKSKMGDLGGTEFLGSQVKKEGSEFNEWYGYQSEGLYLTQDDVENSPKMNKNVKVGDVKYKDISGPDGVPDGLISSEYDRILLGGSLPRYMFGMNFNFGYKDFDLSMSFQGVGKQNSLISSLMVEPLRENWGNVPAILENNYWSSLNTDQQNATAIYPRLTRSNIGNNYAMSDFWLFNGRYIRLKNLTFGYTFPTELTQKAAIKRMRLYVSGNDLFCLSGFPKGWDPEMGNSSYPITTSLLFGVSINF